MSDNVLTVIASDVTEGATITVTATVTGTIFSKPFDIEIKAGETATMSYTGTSTTNMVADANNAKTVGLDEAVFTVTSTKNSGSVHVGLNKSGVIKLYANKAVTLTLTINADSRYKIGKLSLTLSSGSQTSLLINVDGKDVVSNSEGVYYVNAKSIVLSNTSSSVIDIKSITIVYLAPELTDAEKATQDLKALEDISGEYTASSTLTLAKVNGEKSGFEIAYSVTKDSTADNGNGTFVIEDDGTVTITQGDTATTFTVTATIACTCGEETETHKHTRNFAVTVKESSAKSWKLVTAASQIVVGSQIIVANQDDGKGVAMSTTQNSNNRGKADFDSTNPSSSVQIITVETGTDTTKLALKVDSGYLYAAGGTSTSNHLKTNATKTATCDWTITIENDGSAKIVAADSTIKRNTMRYNSQSSCFSCYASGQNAIYLYVLA